MQPAPGSWRDPSSRVFIDGDRVLRVLDTEALADFQALVATKFFQDAVADGRIVATKLIDDVPSELAGTWAGVLEHERIPVITFPFEWTFSMLRDSALLQLDLTEAALADGLITKDATPYNIQFVGSRPTFIDLGSFERIAPGQPWFGYRQFCEQFLNPLLLQSRGIPYQPWLRGELRGITPAQCRAALPFRTRNRPSVFVHVGLHAWAERRFANSTGDTTGELRAAGFNPAIVRGQVRRLRKIVQRLKWEPRGSTWSNYTERGHYTDADLDAKETFVRTAAARQRRRQVLDIGANDGRFSDAVLEHADSVVALDADPLVVDHLYRSLRERHDERIVPVCMDIASMSVPAGWRGQERPGFTDRVKPDLVLALAVVHHLAVTDSVPLDEVAAMLRDFGSDVVVEFPTPDDQMVRRLARMKKAGVVDRYTLDVFEAAIESRFEVIERVTLPSATRILFHLQPRG
ncbi:MAG: class I SAM-dependent methyltransferase [Acidimicrobiia bacterium]|nr:class I SAM-dependent methyltransferase [Acidimicrobiia bacterium]